ncbi:MAG: GntR family transcriptional regulator [Fibrobacteres bacterium]|nr:GntR family transcriptional regulator [Fibrobacterota bacterium]
MKYTELHDAIKSRIKKGELIPGEKLPHTLEIAKNFQVSHATVFRALNLLAQEGVVVRVKSKGTFVNSFSDTGYLDFNRHKRVGWLFRGGHTALLTQGFLSESFLGAEEVLREKGKTLIPIPLDGKTADEYLEEISSYRLSSVILNDLHIQRIHDGLKIMKMPYICTDYLDFNLKVNQVTMDHLKAGALAFGSLFQRGHRKLIFIGNMISKPNHNDSDHEYIWRSFEQSAKMERIKNTKAFFLPQMDKDLLKTALRKIITDNQGFTGFALAGDFYYEAIKELIEKERLSADNICDFVLFTHRTSMPQILGRDPELCRWNCLEMGRVGGRMLFALLSGSARKHSIQYIQVEIIKNTVV